MPLDDIRAPEAYYVLAALARSERELPVGTADRAMDREGFIALVHEPRTLPDGTREWEGRVEFGYIQSTLLADLQIAPRGEPSGSHGTFLMDPQGRVRAEMFIGRSGGQPVILRGERISTTTIDWGK
jgi:hypothetical protein